ncbi:LysR family transcriptional regulator [Paraburkholderia sp. RL17-337-BIB-A]|uniref:LysR family transcriptional regulator n=1 Tax=Paraburkholderia sp. RL17-337-BIB-A TaxID=3031636 RepID=UPI0038BA950D
MDAVSDLEFFVALVKHGSLSALARDVGVTPPAVSARLAQIERRLGVRLLNRTTRRLSMTHEGEQYLTTGSKLLSALQELDRTISSSRATPKGLLRVNATFGFGRRHIAPAIAAFHRQYPDVEVQLELTDRPLNLAEAAFDVGIRFGEIPDSRLIARKVATNRRMVCASPIYVRAKGEPDTPRDLQRHQCIVLRESDTAYGTWHFSKGKRHETVKVHGVLSSNDGEATLVWALEGQGILMRSEWDATTYLQSGRLKQLLPDWSLPPADIYAVYPERLNLTAKVTAFIEFLEGFLGKGPGAG